MSEETDDELRDRHRRVQELRDRAKARSARSLARARDTGRPVNFDHARMAGSHEFTLLQIESELRDRGLPVPAR